MMKHIPIQIIEKKNDSELYIKFKNGSLLILGGTDNPDSWRGTNPIDVVFDEYAEMKEEVWTKVIRPVLTENKGTASFIFTPKGQNHGWRIFNYAKQNKGKLWDYFFLSVEDTKAIPEEELREAKKEMTEAFYQQEFMCEFLSDAGQVFKRINENLHDDELQIVDNKFFQIGVDLAKYQNWTVLTPFDLHTFKSGSQERFNQIDWNLQKAKIEAISRRFNRGKVIIDSTGVGDPIYEDLKRQSLNIESFKFTEESRKQLLENLAILLEQDKIKIFKDEGLIDELRTCQYILKQSEITSKTKIMMEWPAGLTTDRVMSLALSVWGITTPLKYYSVPQGSSEFTKKDPYEEFQKSRFHYEE